MPPEAWETAPLSTKFAAVALKIGRCSAGDLDEPSFSASGVGVTPVPMEVSSSVLDVPAAAADATPSAALSTPTTPVVAPAEPIALIPDDAEIPMRPRLKAQGKRVVVSASSADHRAPSASSSTSSCSGQSAPKKGIPAFFAKPAAKKPVVSSLPVAPSASRLLHPRLLLFVLAAMV